METGEERVAIRIWDLPVRIFHWLLVAIVLFQGVTGWIGGELMAWHLYSGYLLLVIVIFRILWGFVGGTHARFALAAIDGGRVAEVDEPVTLKTAEHASFQTAWEEFGRRRGIDHPPRPGRDCW